MVRKSKKEDPAIRKSPDLRILEELELVTEGALLEGRSLEDLFAEGLDLEGRKISALAISGSLFRSVSLANCELSPCGYAMFA